MIVFLCLLLAVADLFDFAHLLFRRRITGILFAMIKYRCVCNKYDLLCPILNSSLPQISKVLRRH